MKGTIYDPFQDSSSDGIVSRFVVMVLVNATTRYPEKIRFRRLTESPENPCDIAVSYERHGAEELVEHPPMKVWQKVVSKLKVMARMVDYGPNKSDDGYINFRLSKNHTAVFYLPENPNPHTASEVTLIYQGEGIEGPER